MEAIFVLICQILLALIFIVAGATKLTKKRENLMEKVTWAEDYNQPTIRFIGLLELLGGLGVILPLIVGVSDFLWLVPMACMGLAMVMAGAIVVHIGRGEFKHIMFNLVILFMSAGVSFYRLLELNLNWLN